MVSRVKDLAGQKFGRLTVLGLDRVDEKQIARWNCQCDCGMFALSVRGWSLVNGTTISCGCAQREAVSRLRLKHGESVGQKSAEYNAWASMLARCGNPKSPAYKNYGGRGISVSPEWLVFENFLADMGRRPSSDHSIDREKNDLGYSKANCRWATRAQQTRNMRRNQIIKTPAGEMVITDAAAKFGLTLSTLRGRLRRGWPESDLLAPAGSLPRKGA